MHARHQVHIVVIDANIIAHRPSKDISRFPSFRDGERSGSRLLWINGGKTKARGQPIKLPINETTLSNSSMVKTAMTANIQTRIDEIMLRCWRKDVDLPKDASILDAIDRHAISRAGKFWKGNVNTTAKLYDNWTDVAKAPLGKDVVITVRTSFPNAIQQKIPKKV